MATDVTQEWKSFLDPEIQRSRLLSASIFIAAFQSLKDAIVERTRGMFWSGFDESGDVISPRYQTEVLNRNRSPVYASLEWLCDKGAITAVDVDVFNQIKNCRNRLAHELLTAICSAGLPADFSQRFDDLAGLLRKIEVWWIVNMEDMDPNTKESDIIPGRVLSLNLLCRIGLLGDRTFFDEMKKHFVS